MGFEQHLSKVGRAIDDATGKVRDALPASSGEPLLEKHRVGERYQALKTGAKERAEEWWVKYQEMPKAKAAAIALAALCVVLLVTVVALMMSGPSTPSTPSRAKADEIAAMAALRAKMSPNAGGAPQKK